MTHADFIIGSSWPVLEGILLFYFFVVLVRGQTFTNTYHLYALCIYSYGFIFLAAEKTFSYSTLCSHYEVNSALLENIPSGWKEGWVVKKRT